MFLVGAVNQIWMDWWTQIWNRDEKLGTKNGKAYASAGNPIVFLCGSLVLIGTFVKPLYGKYERSWFIKAANWFIAERMFGGRKASQDIFHHIDLNGVRDPMTYLDYHIFTSIKIYQGDSAWSLGPSPEQTRDQTCPAQAHTFMLFMLCFSSELCDSVVMCVMWVCTTSLRSSTSVFLCLFPYLSILSFKGKVFEFSLCLILIACPSCPCIS